MLKLPSAPTGEAEDIVKRFISDRLAEIMEDRMANCLADSLINKRNPDSEDGLLSYDELVASLNAKKLEELTDDLYFAEEVSRYASSTQTFRTTSTRSKKWWTSTLKALISSTACAANARRTRFSSASPRRAFTV